MTNELHHEVELVVAIAKPLQKAKREDLEGPYLGMLVAKIDGLTDLKVKIT